MFTFHPNLSSSSILQCKPNTRHVLTWTLARDTCWCYHPSPECAVLPVLDVCAGGADRRVALTAVKPQSLAWTSQWSLVTECHTGVSGVMLVRRGSLRHWWDSQCRAPESSAGSHSLFRDQYNDLMNAKIRLVYNKDLKYWDSSQTYREVMHCHTFIQHCTGCYVTQFHSHRTYRTVSQLTLR